MFKSLIGFLLLCITPAVAFGQPKDTMRYFITKPLPDYNWDTISADSSFQTYFSLTNDSTKTIILSRVVTGDGGCYAFRNNSKRLSYVVLQAGEKIDFSLKMVPSGKRGAIRRTIILQLQDEQKNTWEKTFKWQGYLQPSSK